MSLPELLTAQESNGDVSIMFPRPDETNGPIRLKKLFAELFSSKASQTA